MRTNKQILTEYVIWHFIISLIILLAFLLIPCEAALAQSADEICQAIWKAEGGELSTFHYGIRSVNYLTGKGEYYDKAEARRICENTVRNNRRRFGEYGHKKFKTFIEFLGSRYAPQKASNDPYGYNKFWTKNVRYFLKVASKSK